MNYVLIMTRAPASLSAGRHGGDSCCSSVPASVILEFVLLIHVLEMMNHVSIMMSYVLKMMSYVLKII